MTFLRFRSLTVALAALLCAALLVVAPARATVLVQLTLEELVSSSEVIFRGEVIDASTDNVRELVYTTVRFRIEEVIAGETDDAVLELRFLGGISGERTTEVSAQYIPPVGANGIFFVDDTLRDLVNPLTGWSQGHFPVIEVDGATWLDLKNHPDYGLLEPDTDPLAGKMRSLNFSREEIAERFPERFRFPYDDFVAAIAYIRAPQEQ